MKNNGGPAFPSEKISHYQSIVRDGSQSEVVPVYEKTGGMSLRDYFAAKAMQGYLSVSNKNDGEVFHTDFETIATMSYQQADHMIKAREETND